MIEVLNVDTGDLVEVIFKYRGRYALGARQIVDLAVIIEKIKLAAPVIAHGKNIDAVLPDIVDLLLPTMFGYYLIDVLDRLDNLRPLLIRDQGFFILELIKLIGRYRYHQAITQGAHSTQQFEMTNMEHIEGAIGNDGFFSHGFHRQCLLCERIPAHRYDHKYHWPT